MSDLRTAARLALEADRGDNFARTLLHDVYAESRGELCKLGSEADTALMFAASGRALSPRCRQVLEGKILNPTWT
jgi:hypothetical protein